MAQSLITENQLNAEASQSKITHFYHRLFHPSIQFYTIYGNQGSVDIPFLGCFWGSNAQIKRTWQFWEPFWDGEKNRCYTSYLISLQREVHSDLSSNGHCSALLQTTLTVHMGHTEDVKLQPLLWDFLFMMEFLSDSKNAEQGENTVLWGIN